MKIITFPKIKLTRQVSNLCDDGSIFKIQNLNSIICMGEKKEKKRIGKVRIFINFTSIIIILFKLVL